MRRRRSPCFTFLHLCCSILLTLDYKYLNKQSTKHIKNEHRYKSIFLCKHCVCDLRRSVYTDSTVYLFICWCLAVASLLMKIHSQITKQNTRANFKELVLKLNEITKCNHVSAISLLSASRAAQKNQVGLAGAKTAWGLLCLKSF